MIGEVIGGCRLLREIGGGNYTTVYEAQELSSGQRRVVKVLAPACSEMPSLVTRFLREATVAAAVSDPGVIRVFAADTHPSGTHYLILEHLEGRSLADHCKDRPLPLTQLSLLHQLACALARVHGAGILHRDLTPQNVMVVPDARMPCGLRAVLIDFGFAKTRGALCTADSDPTVPVTEAGVALGTPHYMSPEHLDSRNQDEKMDVYSLGAMMVRLLSGRPLFERNDLREILLAHLHEPPPPIEGRMPDLPRRLARLINRMVCKDRRARPTVDEVTRVLGKLCRAPARKPDRRVSSSRPAVPEVSQATLLLRPAFLAATAQPTEILWTPALRLTPGAQGARTPARARRNFAGIAQGALLRLRGLLRRRGPGRP